MNITKAMMEQYREMILYHTQALVRIKSVEDTPRPGMPFGEGVNQALEYMLNLAQELGFETVNVEGYAGHADYGQGDDLVAVLVHLDVVPEGTDWDYPPYGGEFHDGLIYGRGVVDDKGPAVASLFAMKALKDAGYMPHKKIRLIFGTDEESGWKDLDVYFQHYPTPAIGFSPDASFPLIYGEKGIQVFSLKGHWQQQQAPVKMVSIHGGNAPNMVPDHCEALISAEADWMEKTMEEIKRISKGQGQELRVEQKDNLISLTTKGVSAHGSTPEKGVNAISRLLLVLNQLTSLAPQAASVLGDYAAYIGTELNGQSIGCGFKDDVSGKLIFNVGMIQGDDQGIEITVNTRYPITVEGDAVIQGIKDTLKDSCLSLSLTEDVAPLYVPVDSPLVETLMQVYREETGDMENQPMTIGGGTYARALKHGVAFGPLLPEREELAHQKNECMSLEDLVLVARIYANALQRLT